MDLAQRILVLLKPADSTHCQLDGASLKLSDLLDVGSGIKPVVFTNDDLRLNTTDVEDSFAQKKTHYGVNVAFGAAGSSVLGDASGLAASLSGLLQGDLSRSLSTSSPLSMPPEWVRAGMCLRLNAFLRGHSSVSAELCQHIAALINSGFTPVVPIRGTVSASGDLSPLAYVAFALSGHAHVQVVLPDGRITTAQQALEQESLEPYRFRDRELLATINGTAMCTAVAATAYRHLASLSVAAQAITALFADALLASPGFVHPLLHDEARPHAGQVEAARNIRGWISQSKLLRYQDESPGVLLQALAGRERPCADPADVYLLQDRYSIRTAPQYLGPSLEDLSRIHDTLTTEINSTTDNPLSLPDGSVVHGGNFQATSVSHAAESMRDVAAVLGRLMHEQIVETLQATSSNALPPCLGVGEPALDGGCRGLDMASSSYVAELGFLASRLSHFNRSAENGNQSVNSMALASARAAIDSVEILCSQVATALYVAAQAIDCRTKQIRFLQQAAKELQARCRSTVPSADWESAVYCTLAHWNRCLATRQQARAKICARSLISELGLSRAEGQQLEQDAATCLNELWSSNMTRELSTEEVVAHLGQGNVALHTWIRRYAPSYGGVSDAFAPDIGPIGVHITKLSHALKRGEADELWVRLLHMSAGGPAQVSGRP